MQRAKGDRRALSADSRIGARHRDAEPESFLTDWRVSGSGRPLRIKCLVALVCMCLVTTLGSCAARSSGGSSKQQGTSASVSSEAISTSAPDDLTDDRVAARLGLNSEILVRLHRERALNNESLVQLPADKLARAIAKLDDNPRPDQPDEAAAFRLLQQQDETGAIPPNALPRAIEQVRELRGQVAALPKAVMKMEAMGPVQRPTVAGLPVGPLQDTPPEAPADDEAAARMTILPLTAGISPTSWVWLGPGNIGGRTRSIVIHPTTPGIMWAGSVAGGVWKTTNGGASWGPLYDFMASLNVACLAIDPTNPNVLYAGTGEGFYNSDALRGAGIFKTTNGGLNWTQLASTNTPNFYFVNRLAFSPNGQVLLAATRTGLYRSTNGGITFTAVAAPANVELYDVDFHPTDNAKCIASGPNGKAFYSINGGVNWIAATGLPTLGRVEVTYARANGNIVYGSVEQNSGEVYRSTNGGHTFTLVNTGTNYLGGQGWYDNVIWAGDRTNANLVLVGGLDLYRSTNGGTTFTQISQWWLAPASAHADHHFIVAHPQYNGTTNRIVYFGNDGGVYRATDVLTVTGTTGWQELNNNYGVTQFYGAAGNPSTGRIVGGTQDNGTIRYTPPPGPNTGTEGYSAMFGGDGGYCAADPTNPNFFYGEYVRLQIHRSINAGTSANYIYTGIADAGSSANFIAPFILDPNNPNTMLAGGSRLWRSVNVKAATPAWAFIKPATTPVASNISAIAVNKGNSSVIWIGHNNGDVYKTTNGTAATPTWTRVDTTTPALPNRFCTRIALDSNPNVAYVTFGGYTTGNVWKTTNAGTTWTNIHGTLPAAPVYSLTMHPSNSNYLYVGTEVGVFASANAGVNWSPTNEGPTNCSVNELLWMKKVLLAATHGRGLFRIDLTSAAPVGPPGAPIAAAADGRAAGEDAAATEAPAVERATSAGNPR